MPLYNSKQDWTNNKGVSRVLIYCYIKYYLQQLCSSVPSLQSFVPSQAKSFRTQLPSPHVIWLASHGWPVYIGDFVEFQNKLTCLDNVVCTIPYNFPATLF